MKKSQNVVEYILIAGLIAAMGYFAMSKIDFKSIRDYVFMRPIDANNSTRIRIEPMTDVQ